MHLTGRSLHRGVSRVWQLLTGGTKCCSELTVCLRSLGKGGCSACELRAVGLPLQGGCLHCLQLVSWKETCQHHNQKNSSVRYFFWDSAFGSWSSSLSFIGKRSRWGVHRRALGNAHGGQGTGLGENHYYWLYENKDILFGMVRVWETRVMGISAHSTSGWVWYYRWDFKAVFLSAWLQFYKCNLCFQKRNM